MLHSDPVRDLSLKDLKNEHLLCVHAPKWASWLLTVPTPPSACWLASGQNANQSSNRAREALAGIQLMLVSSWPGWTGWSWDMLSTKHANARMHAVVILLSSAELLRVNEQTFRVRRRFYIIRLLKTSSSLSQRTIRLGCHSLQRSHSEQ